MRLHDRKVNEAKEAVQYIHSHSASDSKIRDEWSVVFAWLLRTHDLARSRKIPFVILNFPDFEQINDSQKQMPQKILKEFTHKNGIDFIDFTPVYKDMVFGRTPGHAEKYFLDQCHLTSDGYKIVADVIFKYLKNKGLINPTAGHKI